MKLVIASTVAFLLALLANQVETVVTENHYSAWVRARQEQLEADLERSWARDPIILAETKGTPQVHEKTEAVN